MTINLIYVAIIAVVLTVVLRKVKLYQARRNYYSTRAKSSLSKTPRLSTIATKVGLYTAGVVVFWLALPDRFSSGVFGVFYLAIAALIGAVFVFRNWKKEQSDQQFGTTPLFLDPAEPGVGGQLGGCIRIDSPTTHSKLDPNTKLEATLTCSYRCTNASDSGVSRSVEWHQATPVYLKQHSEGVEAWFLFDIPDDCNPTKAWSIGEAYDWSVSVEGNFGSSGLGKFERSWEVIVEKRPSLVSADFGIPQNFILETKRKFNDNIRTSARDQLSVTEDDQYINIHSSAGRDVAFKLGALLFGAVFVVGALFAQGESWWTRLLIFLTGSTFVLISTYWLGKSISVSVDKASRIVRTQQSWFGLPYASKSGGYVDAEQFYIKYTSSSETHTTVTDYYAIELHSLGVKIRIADGIAGKQEAQAIVNAIVA